MARKFLLICGILSSLLYVATDVIGRFRIHSLATILIMITFGALAGSSGARLAAGQPTPWFGVIERINIYTSLLWVAALAAALLRRPRRNAA